MSVYDFSAKTLDGQDASLADYRGQVLLIVNTASKCGFTPQYEGLETLYREYKDEGLHRPGLPLRPVRGRQEPGNAEEIANFCSPDLRRELPGVGQDRRQRPVRPPALRLSQAPRRRACWGTGRSSGTSPSS